MAYTNEVDRAIGHLFEPTKNSLSGCHLLFSHPENSHDDMLWALAVSVYGAREPRKPPAFTFGRE